MRERLNTFSKARFEELKSRYEAAGYKVITRWRKGCKSIRLADINLSGDERKSVESTVSDSRPTEGEACPPSQSAVKKRLLGLWEEIGLP